MAGGSQYYWKYAHFPSLLIPGASAPLQAYMGSHKRNAPHAERIEHHLLLREVEGGIGRPRLASKLPGDDLCVSGSATQGDGRNAINNRLSLITRSGPNVASTASSGAQGTRRRRLKGIPPL